MASDRHCLASVEKGAPKHDGVMVGRTDRATVVGGGGVGGVRVRVPLNGYPSSLHNSCKTVAWRSNIVL